MRVSVCLGAIRIPEYLDFHSGYSAPRSRIPGIYSRKYSYSGISQTNAPLVLLVVSITHLKMPSIETDSESSLIYKLCCLLHI